VKGIPKSPFVFALAILAWIGLAQAEEEPQLAVFVELIELEKADAIQLVAEHAADADAVNLRELIEERLDDEKATLIESIYTRCEEGNRARVDSIEEFIYGTEGDPPEIASDMDLREVENLANLRGTPGCFAAFETRNLGETLEFEVVQAKDVIEIDFSFSVTTLLSEHFFGRSPWMRPENELQHKSAPRIANLQVTSSYRLESGKPVLARMLQPIRDNHEEQAEAKASKKLLVFLTAWSL